MSDWDVLSLYPKVIWLVVALPQMEVSFPPYRLPPDIPQPIDFFEAWEKVPNNLDYDNAFKIQWEEFIRHVALDEPWSYTLRDSAKGVQLAELGMESWRERKWVDVPEL